MSAKRIPSKQHITAIQQGIARGEMRENLDALMRHYRQQMARRGKKPGPYLKSYLALLQAMYANLDAMDAMIREDDFSLYTHLSASANYANMSARYHKSGKNLEKFMTNLRVTTV